MIRLFKYLRRWLLSDIYHNETSTQYLINSEMNEILSDIAIIDEKALMNSLQDGKISGAWIDTFTNEPYNGLLINFHNVILTPHIGSYTKECRMLMEEEAVNNLLKCL